MLSQRNISEIPSIPLLPLFFDDPYQPFCRERKKDTNTSFLKLQLLQNVINVKRPTVILIFKRTVLINKKNIQLKDLRKGNHLLSTRSKARRNFNSDRKGRQNIVNHFARRDISVISLALLIYPFLYSFKCFSPRDAVLMGHHHRKENHSWVTPILKDAYACLCTDKDTCVFAREYMLQFHCCYYVCSEIILIEDFSNMTTYFQSC